jgi:hypothetical protein
MQRFGRFYKTLLLTGNADVVGGAAGVLLGDGGRGRVQGPRWRHVGTNLFWKDFISVVFVERSSTKECSCQPPP